MFIGRKSFIEGLEQFTSNRMNGNEINFAIRPATPRNIYSQMEFI